MKDEIRVSVKSDADLVTARQEGRLLAAQVGFTGTDLVIVATAISEVARNILEYAGTGEVVLAAINDGAARGVSVVARDLGPGIDNIHQAMQEGHTTGRGLGMGLPGARRLMDEFDIVSKPGGGTTVTMKKWL